jgi:hypothetical protein
MGALGERLSVGRQRLFGGLEATHSSDERSTEALKFLTKAAERPTTLEKRSKRGAPFANHRPRQALQVIRAPNLSGCRSATPSPIGPPHS